MDQAHNVQWRPRYPGCHHGQEKSTSRRYAVCFALLTSVSHLYIFEKFCFYKNYLLLRLISPTGNFVIISVNEELSGLCLVQVLGW